MADYVDDEPEPSATSRPPVSLPTVDRRVAVAVVGALALVVAFRVVSWPSVFPGDHVVLSGNDPYHYRYWVEQTLAGTGAVTGGEPLLVAALSAVAGLLGGVDAVGGVMAWYPVTSAVLTAGFLYLLAVRVSRDRRIALVAVVLLAVTPAHALRTSLGFADHHAFDYGFMIVTAAALIWLATRRNETSVWVTGLATLALGVGIAGQVLAWNAGPLLLGAVALAVVLQTFGDIRADRSPLGTQLPVIAGLGLGALLAFAGHLALGWQSPVVAASPALLFGGATAVVIAGEAAHRLERTVREVAAVEGGLGLVALVALWLFLPDYWAELLGGVGRITETGSAIAEMQPLVSVTTLGSLTVLGFLLVAALPALLWATAALWLGVEGADRWIVPIAFGWYFLALSLFQVRFVGELAPFVGLFGGVAFVWLAAKVDLTVPPNPIAETSIGWRPSRPSVRTAAALLGLFVLVGGMAAVQAPIKISQVTIEDATYETSVQLEEYADAQGWTGSGERYVFSEWGRNRVYNYFVNGDSNSYRYAQSNFFDFATSTNPGEWYNRLSGRTAFVVTGDGFNTQSNAMHHRLHEQLGSSGGGTDGLGRYRAITVTADRTRAAFTLVPGAQLGGSGPANASVVASTTVDLGPEAYSYERRTSTNATGAFALRLAQPGTYEVTVGGETTSVSVPEAAVQQGDAVSLGGS